MENSYWLIVKKDTRLAIPLTIILLTINLNHEYRGITRILSR